MNSLELYTGLDMRNQSLDFMEANFGKAGPHCYWIPRRQSRGPREPRPKIGRCGKYVSQGPDQFDALAAELQPLTDKVWRHCEDKGSREGR
jgi:DNA polymerase-4